MTRARWLRLLGDLFLWTSGVGLLLSCYFLGSCTLGISGTTLSEDAASQAAMLRSQILAFRARHGHYPATLDDTVTEKDGRPPLIDGGPRAVLDPWGNRFQFEVIPGDETTPDEEVAVWTVSPKGERIESMRSRNRRR